MRVDAPVVIVGAGLAAYLAGMFNRQERGAWLRWNEYACGVLTRLRTRGANLSEFRRGEGVVGSVVDEGRIAFAATDQSSVRSARS